MPEAVDVGGVIVGFEDGFIVVAVVGEFPFFDFVDGDAADADGSLFAHNGQGAFEVFGIGQHGDVEGADGAVAEFQDGRAGILGFDVAGEGGGRGHDALDVADQPIQHIDVVAGLVHEGAAVEFPGAAPFGGIVILLGSGPEHIALGHVDAAETAFVDGCLQALHRRVQAILLDHEEMDFAVIADLDHFINRSQGDAHGFFRDDMLAGFGHLDSVVGVQTAWRGDDDGVEVCLSQHGVEIGEGSGAGFLGGLFHALRDFVTDGDKGAAVAVVGERLEMVFGDSSAAYQTEFFHHNLESMLSFLAELVGLKRQCFISRASPIRSVMGILAT